MVLHKITGNLSRLWGTIIKTLKTSARDKPLYFWVFGYPLLFIMIFFIAFNSSGGRSAYSITIINYDTDGASPNSFDGNASLILMDLFNSSVHDTNLTKTFTLKNTNTSGALYTETEAIELVKVESLDAVIILPQNFTENIVGSTWWYRLAKDPTLNETYRTAFIASLPLGFQYLIASTNYSTTDRPNLIIHSAPDIVVKSVIQNVFDGIVNNIMLQFNNLSTLNTTVYEVGVTNQLTAFDYYAPGFIIVGVTIAVMMVAQNFGTEKEKGLLKRLDTTPVPRSILLIGGGLAQVLFSSIQILLLMGCLIGLGIQVHPDANWGLAFLNAFILAIPCIGIGLIIAAVVKSGDEAGGLSWIAILPLQFLGNAFFPLGDEGIVKFFPTYYGVSAMRKILLQGLDLGVVWPDLLTNFLFGVVFVVIGLIIFQKKSQI